ncbi:hypothetical protein BHYA_0049g00550 [Botrytis hyacinthi]|uniref:Uncharacterized protein n=1 Tax=Botrytis hyacinthi TaxID=278943 RepID=A0A4Z1GVH9_9HELO|nr:hypothetical protein BHYA_0049g00550 [Botrytis hyacinthi]
MDEIQAHFDVTPNRWRKERNTSLSVPLKGQQRKHEKSTRESYGRFLDRQNFRKESRNDAKKSSTSKSERRGKPWKGLMITSTTGHEMAWSQADYYHKVYAISGDGSRQIKA